MRIRDIYKILGVVLFMAFAVSCDMLRTAEQDASPVISPDSKPTVTYTANITGNAIKEGEKLIYTIKLDKPIDRALTFSAHYVSGSAIEGDDYEAATVVIQPYTTEVKMEIAAIMDDYPEVEETLKLEIGIFGIAERYLINPSTVNPMVVDLKITNKNDPAKLTIAMEWAGTKDFDFVTWSNTTENPMTEWGDGGASSHNPEIDKSIWLADPVGTYYVNIMDWDDGPFNYKFSIGHPNGSVQFIEGTFDRNTKVYINDIWKAWGDPADSFRVLNVNHTGTAFTVTKL